MFVGVFPVSKAPAFRRQFHEIMKLFISHGTPVVVQQERHNLNNDWL
jgi:hypothetical protein